MNKKSKGTQQRVTLSYCASEKMAAAATGGSTYKVEDLKGHATDKSCWLAINGSVYDVTEFLEEHPGGYDIILTSTGECRLRSARLDPQCERRWVEVSRCMLRQSHRRGS
jgi:hypothetical protein